MSDSKIKSATIGRVQNRKLWSLVFVSLLACFESGFGGAEQATDNDSRKTIPGRQLFVAHCGRCHGIAGAGGTGPSLVRPQLRKAPDDRALGRVIKGGIGGTGMPGNWMLSSSEVEQIVEFVRSIGQTIIEPPPGDADRGRQVYQTAQCAACHIIRGGGGSLGPELTSIGSQRGIDYLRKAVLHPGSEKPRDTEGFISYLTVQAIKRDGSEVEGVRLNEDSFTIQLRDSENRFHSFRKRDLKEIRRKPNMSIMPSFEDALSGDQVDDLVAYLTELQGE